MEPEPVHILLVEDSAGDALLMQQVLTSSPVALKLHIARDGEQALQMLADPNLKPSLIILDLNLPRVTGLELLQRYDAKSIPVVVFSSSSSVTDKQFAYARGASEYVEKPTELQAFTDAVCGIINKWVGPKESGAAASLVDDWQRNKLH
jgi:CheY-like chemotaxis protein